MFPVNEGRGALCTLPRWNQSDETKNNQAVQQLPVTVITREYPMTGAGLEPYYPVNDERNNRLYQQYRELAGHEPHVIFGGRLATYQYMDMDEVMESAMMISRR